ncbi:MAG TPA: EAL domain-containing protein [Candidatus Competibacteraceae bacterium]|nr:EAL domain-containing protein [Candidatus Competibacteraceae bacterium]
MTGSYDIPLVILSVIVAVFASFTALHLASRVAHGRAGLYWLVGGALAMGTGIWAMHFLGMLAFRLPVPLGYEPGLTLLSLLIAVIVSGFALYLVSRPRLSLQLLILGGLAMGLGICGMHYTGMAAMRMLPPIEYDPWLFAASVVIAIGASLLALSVAFRLRDGLSGHFTELQHVGAAVILGSAISGMHYTGMAAAHFAPGSLCLTSDGIGGSGLAAAIAVITLLILSLALVVTLLDARLESKARLAEQLHQANRELTRLVRHDTLTGLPGRALLEERIARQIEQAQARQGLFAVVFIDLDGFKEINDSLGHHQGDELLRQVAARLSSSPRHDDLVARIGGDEFVLVAGISAVQDVAAICERVLATLTRPVLLGESQRLISASLGVALYPYDGDDARSLLINADAAMYRVKKRGRNGYELYAAAGNADAQRHLELQYDLYQGLQSQQFELHYQPIFACPDGRIVGAEALLRWCHPDKGLIAPGEFIPLAERTGLIIALGQWVLQQSCRQLARWRAQGHPLWLSLNLSPRQFEQADLVESMRRVLTEWPLPAGTLVLEITESVALHNPEHSVRVLEELERLGLRVALDNFGTGYSSLGYLRRFCVHKLKIDCSFIANLGRQRDDALVAAIIALGHTLGLQVVAEGVETPQQFARLRQLGCDEVQGFLLGRPMPAAEFEAWLARPQPLTLAGRPELHRVP